MGGNAIPNAQRMSKERFDEVSRLVRRTLSLVTVYSFVVPAYSFEIFRN